MKGGYWWLHRSINENYSVEYKSNQQRKSVVGRLKWPDGFNNRGESVLRLKLAASGSNFMFCEAVEIAHVVVRSKS